MMFRLAMLSMACLILINTRASAQELNKLDSCEDVAALFALSAQDVSGCQEPNDSLSRQLVNRLSGASLCFFTPLQRSLSGFQCVQMAGRSQIECYKETSSSIVRDYADKYDQGTLNVETEDYVKRAAKCSYSNGLASPMGATVSGPALFWVARMAVAFGSETGPREKPTGVAIHGYATVDPSIEGAPQYIEFFTVIGSSGCRINCGGSFQENEEKIAVNGDMSLYRDNDAHKIADAMNEQARHLSAPVRSRVEVVELRNDNDSERKISSVEELKRFKENSQRDASVTADAFKIFLGRVERKVVDSGYSFVPESQIEAMGFSIDQMRQSIRNNPRPYGATSWVGDSSSFSFKIYVKDHDLACAENGKGMLAVALIEQDNRLAVMVVGAGSCEFNTREPFDDVQSAINLDSSP